MKRDLSFTWEPVAHLLSCGLHDMAYRHWAESKSNEFPYDPDWEGYERLERDMVFRILAVRFQGHLVGYAGVRVYQNMQSRGVTCSYIQEYYVEPKFRPMGAGLELFRTIEAHLRLMNVQHVTAHVPEWAMTSRGGLGRFFQYLGYAPKGNLWSKTITAGA